VFAILPHSDPRGLNAAALHACTEVNLRQSIVTLIMKLGISSQNLKLTCPIHVHVGLVRQVSMMSNERKISQLAKEAELNIGAGNLKEAEHRLFQAWGMAKQTRNQALASRITDLFGRIGLVVLRTQSIDLSPLETDGFILDIGGGGEGIIGKLNGAQVVAIDTSERELAETKNEALKVVMDATDLKFLPDSFDICTAFFSLMYIPKSEHPKVFEEAHRVLKDNGQFLLWDVRIPRTEKRFKEFIVPLKVQLPDETVETGYGVRWQAQDVTHFRALAKEQKFKVVDEWSKGELFHLRMLKKASLHARRRLH
jgi:SAM-dependent methyltransferase